MHKYSYYARQKRQNIHLKSYILYKKFTKINFFAKKTCIFICIVVQYVHINSQIAERSFSPKLKCALYFRKWAYFFGAADPHVRRKRKWISHKSKK